MSIGTRQLADYDKLQNITAEMIAEGQVIVAAGSNAGDYTMPAGMGGILGVMANRRLEGPVFLYRTFYKGIGIEASAVHRLEGRDRAWEVTVPANSFAAPTLTAAVSRILGRTGGGKAGFLPVFGALFPGKRYAAFRPDFMEEAVVLNLSENPLRKEYFFFSYTEITIADIWQEETEKERKKSFIFLPGVDEADNGKVLSYLGERQKQFLGIVYCGEAEQEFIGKIKDCILWCEQDCGIYRQPVQIGIKEPDSPVVLIKSKEWQGGKLAGRLKRKFGEQGYQCIAASTHLYSYLYGFEYIPAEIKKERIIPYLEEMYRPDIMILWCHETEDTLPVKKEDIYSITVNEGCAIGGVTVYDLEEEFENLYQAVVSYFS